MTKLLYLPITSVTLIACIYVFITHNIVFTQITARLNLNQHHWHFAGVFHPVLIAHRNINRLIFPNQVQRVSDKITDRLSRGNSLYRNEGDGTFTDVSDEAGVRDGQWGWGAQFMDYDNNGRLDLYAVNGFLSGPIQDDL